MHGICSHSTIPIINTLPSSLPPLTTLHHPFPTAGLSFLTQRIRSIHAWPPSLPRTHLQTHACMAMHGHTKLPSLHPNPATSMQAPISMPILPLATFFSLRPRIHHHPHLHARESSSVAGKRAAAKQAFHSSQTSPELFLGFCAAASVRGASLQAVDGGLLAVLFDCSRGVVDGAISGDVHQLVPWLRKPRISTISAPPSLPLSLRRCWWRYPEGVAQMERMLLGCEGAFVW